MKSKFNITIIGAGITGLMFAALLTRGQHAASLNIKLIEKFVKYFDLTISKKTIQQLFKDL